MKDTILITGAAGYIGSMMVGYFLREQYRVIGVDNFTYSVGPILPHLGDPNFEFYRVDARDLEDGSVMSVAAKQADVVIPLAALVGAPLCEKRPKDAASVNYFAIRDLLRKVDKWARVLYPNTNSGYGQTDGENFLTEEDPLNPISVYGRTKCQAEKVVLEHRNSAVFRLATVFGASSRPRFDLLVNDWTAKLYYMHYGYYTDDNWHHKAPSHLKIYEPGHKRNFVHVRDVCRAFGWAMTNRKMTGVYNLGLPTANLTKWELAQTICKELRIPESRLSIAEGSDPDQRNYLVSNQKLLDTGFVFRHGLASGIHEVARICSMLHPESVEKMGNL